MEFGDFAMMRRMLRGIKRRAETLNTDLMVEGIGRDLPGISRPEAHMHPQGFGGAAG
jgi:hypothetical protein